MKRFLLVSLAALSLAAPAHAQTKAEYEAIVDLCEAQIKVELMDTSLAAKVMSKGDAATYALIEDAMFRCVAATSKTLGY